MNTASSDDMLDVAREGLKDAFEDTARWRREKAEEYPNDERNLAAAQSLDRLASTVDQVDANLLVTYGEEFDDDKPIDSPIELQSELLRQIGFHSDYDDAADFVQTFISKRLEHAAA